MHNSNLPRRAAARKSEPPQREPQPPDHELEQLIVGLLLMKKLWRGGPVRLDQPLAIADLPPAIRAALVAHPEKRLRFPIESVPHDLIEVVGGAIIVPA